jgi:hypothetical protein
MVLGAFIFAAAVAFIVTYIENTKANKKLKEWQIDILFEYKVNDENVNVYCYHYNPTRYNPSCKVYIEDVYDQIRHKNSHIVQGNALCVFIKPEEIKHIWMVNTVYLDNHGKEVACE